MADIVAFPADAVRELCERHFGSTSHDRFLLDEGLELLADFKSISDDEVRASVRALVKTLAHQALRAAAV